MKNNLMKYIKSKKFIDIFCYVFCGIYFLFALLFAFSSVLESKQQEKYLNDTLTRINALNKQVENSNLFKKDETSNDDDPSEPIFSDGKTALLSAYEKFYNANSFYISASGTITTVALGINIKLSFQDTAVRFDNTKAYNELLVKYLDASSMQSMMEKEVQYGEQLFLRNNEIKHRETLRVRNESGKLTGYEYGNIETPSEEKKLVANNLLIVNEETIKDITYFEIKYKNGKPKYYYVQAELDPQKATVDFGKSTSFRITTFNFGVPRYSKCTLTAMIDAQGNLFGLRSNDTAEIDVTGTVSLTAPANYSFTYAISGIDKEITFAPEGW